MRRYCFLTAWAVANTAWAAPGIDAGSLLQQMERDRRVPVQPPETSGISPLQAPASDEAESKALRFSVQKITLRNVSAFDESVLLELFADTVGRAISLSELRERIKRISDYYHTHGYPAAYAYLPEQTIAEDGEVEVRVLEGYLGEIHLHNHSRLVDAAAQDRLLKMKPGDLLRSAPLERSALLISDIPGVAVQPVLNPGRDPGFTDVDLTLTDKPVLSTQLSVDNQGSRYTGDGSRFAIHPEISNFTGYGDRLSASLMSGGFGMKYKQLQYQLPSYWTGVGRAGVEYGEINYRLGRELIASGAQGTTRTTALYGNYPILRGDARNLSVEVRHQEKLVRDELLVANDINGRKSYSQVLALNGDWQDSALNWWSLGYTTGRLDFANQTHLTLDAASAKTLGHYGKYNWSYTREQAVAGLGNTVLVFHLSGQVATGRNLDPSEKMVLGGRMGVRAYPSSEGMTDQATFATMILKHQLTPQFMGSVFFDYGRGVMNKHPWPAVANTNKVELGGAGVGVGFDMPQGIHLSLMAAWRTTKAKPSSGGDTPGGRVWIELGLAL